VARYHFSSRPHLLATSGSRSGLGLVGKPRSDARRSVQNRKTVKDQD
jgi:hypothetical protein